MEDNDHSFRTKPKPFTTAINVEYAAFASNGGVDIRSLDSSRHRYQDCGDGDVVPRSKVVAAFSPTQQTRLAVSGADGTVVSDVRYNARTHILPGTGRAVTAIAWSYHDADVIATGAIDGSTQIWTLKQTWRPLTRIAYSGAPCTAIAWSPVDSNILAMSGGGTVAIWTIRPRPKLVKTLNVGRHHVTSLVWHPSHSGRLLSASSDATVRVWDVTGALSSVRNELPGADVDSDEEDLFGELDGLQKLAHPITRIQLAKPPIVADWIGEYGAFVLSGDGTEAAVYSYGAEFEMPHEVWRLNLAHHAETAVVRASGGATMLTVASRATIESHRIPSAVLDSVGGHAQSLNSSNVPAVQDFAGVKNGVSNPAVLKSSRRTTMACMTPVAIAQLRAEKGSFAKTSKQIQQRRRTDSQRSRQTAITALADSVSSPVSSPSRAMTSSLELPNPHGDGDDPLMPFLSPSIPARRPSPNTLTAIEDSLHLPPLQSIPSESMPMTITHDSDSDDETFAEGMQDSGSFLPGGINVPLPKGCGALFAPNGHLLAFFQPKLRPQAVREPDMKSAETEQRAKASRVARLFQTFGDLTANASAFDDDNSDSDSFASSVTGPSDDLPTFAMQPASFQSQFSWDVRTSPVKPTFTLAMDPPKVVVSAYDVGDLLPSRLAAAEDYRILHEIGESGSQVCLHNASIAEHAGLCDASDVWRLVAMLLEGRVPLEVQMGADDAEDVLIVARKVTSMLRADSEMDRFEAIEDGVSLGSLRWAEHPLARGWLIRQTFHWAEQQADVQMLACISAILAEAEESAARRPATAERSMLAKLSTCTHQYGTYTDTNDASLPNAPPIPVLRTDSNPIGTVTQSPTKARQASQASSRNTSQPSTPYLDSSSSTPPFQFPTFSRQGSKLSISNSDSVSPEHHRSSFSAAAKHYAQSITDKFATSYGTSPPARKFGTSPGSNEALSSLPAASGSWSKSVSFASSASATRDSQLSRSYTDKDDDYDSDRTIDDNSLPHTPKDGATPVSIQRPNKDAFSDDVSGCCQLPLLPQDLAAKGSVWRQHYADQLRCWGLWMQAAELEKISGLTKQSETESPLSDGMMPIRASGQRKATCSICCSVIASLEQLCPACLHTAHLACLETYLTSLDGEAYECPTGCGCACDELPVDSVVLSLSTADEAAAEKTVKKKASLTDPRLWRSRLEGNSW
ncbi:hypothetical protein LTR85_009839 [Meristemomyces frigidus]|nr:hypothetical protein LTR85_009839 [Meristemomyces frigidus]